MLRLRFCIFLFVAIGCDHSDALEHYQELSSHVISMESCGTIIYSSNKENTYSPYVIKVGERLKIESVTPIQLSDKQDFFSRSISNDCKLLSLVSDNGGNQIYDVYVYNFYNKSLTNLTKTENVDDGNPIFSPIGSFLAFLSNGRLVIYNYVKKEFIPIGESPTFRSLEWHTQTPSLILEDENANLWHYDIENGAFALIFESKDKTFVPLMAKIYGDSILYISDSDGFSQPYIFDLQSEKSRKIFTVDHDVYSLTLSGRSLNFRMNVNGHIGHYKYSNDTIVPIIDRGVVYQTFQYQGHNLALYADVAQPKTLIAYSNGKITDLLNNTYRPLLTDPIVVKNEHGMHNFCFLPAIEPWKGYVVWIHGGPHEQVSPRFNIFFDRIVAEGWGVVAVNYLGSTGIGNPYEYRGKDFNEVVKAQVRSVEKDLSQMIDSIHNENIVVVGVSYGSIIAHGLAASAPFKIRGMIDISGLFGTSHYEVVNYDSTHSIPQALFVAGVNDYALTSPRVSFIEQYERLVSSEILLLEDEGHFIRRKGSIEKVSLEIVNFLRSISSSP